MCARARYEPKSCDSGPLQSRISFTVPKMSRYVIMMMIHRRSRWEGCGKEKSCRNERTVRPVVDRSGQTFDDGTCKVYELVEKVKHACEELLGVLTSSYLPGSIIQPLPRPLGPLVGFLASQARPVSRTRRFRNGDPWSPRVSTINSALNCMR